MSDPLLVVEGLRTVVSAGGVSWPVVDGVSFHLNRGETFALVGESGCGKSLTALSITRLLPREASVAGGHVRLGGVDLALLPERDMRDIRGRRIAMIFQEPATSLNPVLTVGAQVEEALVRHLRLSPRQARQRVVELFEAVGIPDARRRLSEFPFQLSGGLRQRVMIAMAIACEPDILIADEPTTALDVTIQAQVLELLRDLQRRTGMAMLLITHDLGVVSQMASRVAVMYAGRLVEMSEASRFFASPMHPYSRKLFASLPEASARGRRLASIPGFVPSVGEQVTGCRFAPRCERAEATCRADEPALVEVVAGREVRCIHAGLDALPPLHPEADVPPTDVPVREGRECTKAPSSTLLEVTGLTVHFPIRRGLLKRVVGYVRAVDGVSFQVREGRTLALVGESGCGKTTVGKSVVRLLEESRGSVAYDGVNLETLAQRRLRTMRKKFQIVFQDPFSSLDPRMRVAEILKEGIIALDPGCGPGARSERTARLLEQVGLEPESQWRYPHEFSGGQRQRIAIARALAVEPRLLVCDEPTSALDVSVQAQILNLLLDLQDRLGLAYLFITHNLSVVRHIAHDVAVMYLGRIVEHGEAEAVLNAPAHPYTRALLEAVPRIGSRFGSRSGALSADLPSPASPPSGCHFHPRCAQALDTCRTVYPSMTEAGSHHGAACHLLRR